MGTKLHQAVNLLPTLANKKVEAVDIGRDLTHSWACSREGFPKEKIGTGYHQLEDSMDRLLEQYNRESLRKTMLKQEETFRDQVHELHRLYRVQKVLMSELRSKELKLSGQSSPRHGTLHGGPDYRDLDIRSAFWSTSTSPQASSSPFSNTHHSYNFHQRHNVSVDPSSQEPSSTSQDTSRARRGFDLERPADQDNSACPSAVEDRNIVFGRNLKDTVSCEELHDPPFCPEEESDIELTLSIGCGRSKNKSDEKKKQNSSTAVRSDRVEEDQESLKRPHWLFRTLSLNRT
ncbi:uncharacterized protein [Aristolochia californica]|uniref:uncharacterized protein isoform X1 n=1 Tax=Aristolochia californica TaxID=171875 RepID=UPI0035D544FB